MDKPLAYSYIRMSTNIQLKGDSLRRQEELSVRYAEKHGLELDADFKLQDIGVSAFHGDNSVNGALSKFIEAIKNGEIPKGSYLLVESLDRLSRQKIGDALQLFLGITNSGINIVTLSDEQVYKAGIDDFSQLIVSIAIMSRAYEESQTKSKRLSAAWGNKRDNADTKILTARAPLWLKPKEDRSGFDIIPKRVEIIHRIFNAATNGQGSGYITRALNGDKITPFGRSNIWQESYVTKILKSRTVLGEYQPHRKSAGKRTPIGEAIKNYYPPVVKEDVFLKVQADRRQRKVSGAGRKGQKQNNLFTHIAKCYYCGGSMRFLDKGKGPKGGKYLKCSNAVNGVECISKAWRYNDFEASFFSFVREFDLQSVIERTSVITEQAKIRVELTVENERIIELKSEQEQVFELLKTAGSSTDFIRNKLDGISSKINEVEGEVEKLEKELQLLSNSPTSNLGSDDVINILKDFNNQNDIEKRFLVTNKLKELIRKILVAPAGKKNSDLLQDTTFYGPLGDPFFIVIFNDEVLNWIVPNPSDPLELLYKFKVSKDMAYLVDTQNINSSQQLSEEGGFPVFIGSSERNILLSNDD